MRVTATTEAAASTAADTVVVGLIEGERIHHDVDDGALAALAAAGEAKAAPRHVAVAHAAGKRWILVGLGARARLDAQGLRVAPAPPPRRGRGGGRPRPRTGGRAPSAPASCAGRCRTRPASCIPPGRWSKGP